MPVIRSRIRKDAIAVLILCFAATWSRNAVCRSPEAGNEPAGVLSNAMAGVIRRIGSTVTPVFKIEVDIFSGRPNPVLDLRGSRAQHLQRLLEKKRQPLSKDAADQLGFRGFIIRLEGTGREAYRVKGEVVQIGGKAFLDPNRDTQN